MGVDAGSIYSDVRVRLSALNGDILAITSAFDKLGVDLDGKTKKTNAGLVKNFMTAFAAIRDVMMGPVAAVKEIVAGFMQIKAKLDEMENKWADSAEASALLANTLKTTGAEAWTTKQHLDEVAASLQDVTKYEGDTISAMQNVLLGFRNITGKEFDHATEAVLDMATVMKMDLTSAAQTVGKALDNPSLGLDSLSRQGFKFTKQEKEMMKAMQEAGDIAGAQAIILKELDKTYGGAARAAGDLNVSLRDKLKNAIGDVNEEIGRSLSGGLAPFRERWLEIAKAVGAAAKAQNDFREALDKTKKGTADVDDYLAKEAGLVEQISIKTKAMNAIKGAGAEKIKAKMQAEIDALNAERNAVIDNRKALEDSDKRRIQAAKDKEEAEKKAAAAALAASAEKKRLAEYEAGAAENARRAQSALTEEAYRQLRANRALAAIKFANMRDLLNGYTEDPEVAEQIRRINGELQSTKDQTLAAFVNVKDLLGGYTEDPAVNALIDEINAKLKETEERAKTAAGYISDGIAGSFNALGEAIAKDEDPAKAFFKSLINSLGDTVLAYASAIEAMGWFPVFNPLYVAEGAGLAFAGGAIKGAAAVMDTGGIVIPQSTGGVPTLQSVNGFPELNINGGPSGRAFLREFAQSIAAEMGAGGGSGGQPIQLFVDGKLMAAVVTRYQDNNQVGRRR